MQTHAHAHSRGQGNRFSEGRRSYEKLDFSVTSDTGNDGGEEDIGMGLEDITAEELGTRSRI